MPVNLNRIIVIDFETGGRDPTTCEVLQIAAIPLNPRTLNVEQQSPFSSLVKPFNWDNVEQKALDKNKLKRDELEKAPSLDIVWPKFVNYVKSFNRGGKEFFAPIAAGYNLKNFDMPIVKRLCEKYGDMSGNRQNVFNTRIELDVLDICFLWFESSKEPKNYQLDSVREYLGVPLKGAHNALVDVVDTGKIISRFLKLHRGLLKRIKFAGAFNGEERWNTAE